MPVRIPLGVSLSVSTSSSIRIAAGSRVVGSLCGRSAVVGVFRGRAGRGCAACEKVRKQTTRGWIVGRQPMPSGTIASAHTCMHSVTPTYLFEGLLIGALWLIRRPPTRTSEKCSIVEWQISCYSLKLHPSMGRLLTGDGMACDLGIGWRRHGCGLCSDCMVAQ